MDFDAKLDELEQRIAGNKEQLESVKAHLKQARKFTAKFLGCCGKRGISKVAIHRAHESVPISKTFPFGASGNIFAIGNTGDGWPAIWGAAREMDIHGGCGNGNQVQSNHDPRLIDGTYHLKGGKWCKVD